MRNTAVTLSVSIFTNAGTVPLEIAARRSFFADAGLDVTVTGTTSSVEQMTGVIDGRYDIAATAIDNVIAYNVGQGAAATLRASDLKVFMGSASYRLPLLVAPHVRSFADLRGAEIAVDALSTGFAFLLREMLAINGLPPGSYELVPTGAPKERWDALRSGKASGALLNAYLEAVAHAQGCHTLTSEPDPWDGYQGNVFCARSELLSGDRIDGFRLAVLRAVDVVRDPANAEEVAEALVAHLGQMTPEKARATAQALSGSGSILMAGLPISRAGTETVIRLRERYTGAALGVNVDDLFDPRAKVVA
jgi:ABC-type nitrate/sulfonate/bicarbonate transport system substrate-binding protein